MNEKNDMHGYLTIRVSDGKGHVIYERPCKNRIVTSGRMMVARMFGGITTGPSPTRVTHMAVGTDGTAPADGDTSLKAPRGGRKPISEITYEEFDEPQPGTGEISQRRTGAIQTVPGVGEGEPTEGVDEPISGGPIRRVRARLTAEFDYGEANGDVPLREAGVFNAATGGVMYNRVGFEPVTKTAAFKLTLIWDIVF